MGSGHETTCLGAPGRRRDQNVSERVVTKIGTEWNGSANMERTERNSHGGGQHCNVGDPVVRTFSYPVVHLPDINHALGKRTVGVNVSIDNTEIYVFP